MTAPWMQRRRPPWWPESEAWPPERSADYWLSRRRHFGHRLGVLFAIWLFLAILGAASVASWGASAIGLGGLPASLVTVGPLMVLLIVVALVFFGAMRRVGGPFSDVVSAADRIGSGDFSVRAREAGPPFIRTVARTFNVMAGKLQSQDQQRRRLFEDVAHELRTPLAIMRGRVEGMIDGVYEPGEGLKDVLEQTKTLERLVADLSTLATAEAGSLRLEPESTDITALVRGVVSSFDSVAADARVRVSSDLPTGAVFIDVDRIRMREILANLIANAIQHTPPEGDVVVRAHVQGTTATIEVIDTGRGIAAHDLDRVFDRFYRGPESRGHGLGLAIARHLVLAHQGTIRATSSPGAGTTMTVVLPQSRDE